MADTAYTYAVARVRAKEVFLLSNADIEQLIALKTEENCLAFLREKGWGNGSLEESADEMLSNEMTKAWREAKDLVMDRSVFDVLMAPREYHNLKAAIKKVCAGDKAENIFFDDTLYNPDELMIMIAKRKFDKLPKEMAEVASVAVETLLQTKDGQMCDILIDRATLEAIAKIGENSSSAFVKEYVKDTLMVADIRIAVRSAKTGKSKMFMDKAMVECEGIKKKDLIDAAVSGITGVCDYLEKIGKTEIVEAIKESPSAFEKWCDNKIMDTIMSQKYNSFSEGPILAYILAKENEIKTVRVILTGKVNELDEDFIRERVRKMYV
ncbi:MAG: V-type ATP synthase subunit C [Lachnospiraceae bacterium]|nr:V-type ATP synthase subunit C [Lachnospiraceae bacterium]